MWQLITIYKYKKKNANINKRILNYHTFNALLNFNITYTEQSIIQN